MEFEKDKFGAKTSFMFNISVGASTQKLLKDTSVYGTGALANSVIPVLLLPILTRYLTPAEYGVVSIFTVVVGVMLNFIGLNLSAAIQRNYVDHNREELSHYIGTALIIAFIALLFWLGIVYGFKEAISRMLSFPGSWLPTVLVVAFFNVSISIVQLIWRMERNPAAFVFFQLLQTITNLCISIVLVVGFLMHWQGRLTGIITTTVLFGLISIYILYKKGYLRFSFNKLHAISMLLFSTPLIFQTLSTWIMGMSDRLFLANMVGAGAVGLYSAGYAIGQIIQILQQAFSQAWVPHLFESLKAGNQSNKVEAVKVIYIHHLVLISLVLILKYLAPYIVMVLLAKDFRESSGFVVWIAAGYAFNGMYRMLTPLLNYARKTHLLMIGTAISASVNLALNYLLIKKNGPIGAAQATFCSFLIHYVITLYLTGKVCEMPWFFWLKKEIWR